MKIKYFLFLFFLIVFIKTQFQNIENNNSTSFKKFGLQNETLNQESILLVNEHVDVEFM